MNIKLSKKSGFLAVMCIGLLTLITQSAFAANDLGTMATSITNTFEEVGKLITAGSYLAGLGFAIGGILKFKAHKDNPTQVTIGQPLALVFVAASLLFLPSILGMVGGTMFGDSGGVTAGSKGMEITGKPK